VAFWAGTRVAPEKPENTGKKAARSAIRTTVDQIKLCDSWLANQLVEAVRLLIVRNTTQPQKGAQLLSVTDSILYSTQTI
jgi:hypothetical protein